MLLAYVLKTIVRHRTVASAVTEELGPSPPIASTGLRHAVNPSQAAGSGFAVGRTQVVTGLHQGFDDFIEADTMAAIAGQGVIGAIDRPRGGERIAFDARRLHQPQDRIAGQS